MKPLPSGLGPVTQEMNADRRVRVQLSFSKSIHSLFSLNPTGTKLGFSTCMFNSPLFIAPIT